jgi:hypothetical protein
MSQNEKLRTLLSEARDLFKTMRQADAFAPHAYDRGDDDASIVDLARHIHARIDATLAEPTGPERSPLYPGEGTWSVFAEKVERDRDEARAALADAYRRGAEAMREQAAMVDPYGLHLDRAEFARVISGPASIVQIIRAGIRALPIPEDT